MTNTAKSNNVVENKVNPGAYDKQKAFTLLEKFLDLSENPESRLKPEKNLLDRVKYALSKKTKVTVTDLRELVAEVREVVKSFDLVKKPVEASVKPSLKKKADTPKKEVVEDKPQPKLKKAAVETVPAVTNVGIDRLPLASVFPQEIDHDDLGKLVATTKYQNFDELMKDVLAEKEIYFAAYWTKRHIKEYEYAASYRVKAPKNGFPLDLDISQACIPCETIKRLWTMSIYTEAVYFFDDAELAYVEDVDPRGDGKAKFKVRVSAGMEYEIYIPAKDAEAEDKPVKKSKSKK